MVLKKINSYLTGKSKKFPSDFKKIINEINIDIDNHEVQIDLLWKAYEVGNDAHKNQLRKSGKPYFSHCVEVACTLAKWKMDIDTIIAGLLHDTIEDTYITKEDITNTFNQDIAELVEGVSKLSGIKFNSRQEKQAENFMKMFLSVAKDLRVIIIKFADRLHNMNTINHLPRIKQRRIAVETRDVFAPLAHRLGMNQLKTELEDLVFKTIDPDNYYNIDKKIKATKRQREKYIKNFISPIDEEMKSSDINIDIFGRAKHYYSISSKMNIRNKAFEDIFDLFAIRIVVNKIEECYAVLGVVHQLYTPLQDRFKDYIATPKSNGYRSIHTTVFGDNGQMVEVQIRTQEMNQMAEIGVAAHWIYKETNSEKSNLNKHISWLRELVEILQSEEKNPDEFLKLLKVDLFEDEIFVFSPKGDVSQLPVDSSPVDFAFNVHTQVGLHCSGAKVNGKMVPLNTKLKNGDSIEIVTSDNQLPNDAWLKIVKTAKAKSHIKKWIKKKQFDQSIKLGKEIIEKDLRRINKIKLLKDIKSNPEALGYNNEDLVYSEVADGQLTVHDIVNKYDPQETNDYHEIKKPETLTEKFLNKARGIAKGVTVDGLSNTLITFAQCCSPIPGDEIIGYITRGRGVTIHICTCSNIPSLSNENRFIDVEWDVSSKTSFIVRLKIICEDRKNIIRDITEVISSFSMNIQSIDMRAEDGLGSCILILETRDTKQLLRLKKRIKKIPKVISLERL